MKKIEYGPDKKPGEDCRICNGPCKGIQYHPAIESTWLNQEPATVENWWRNYHQKRKGGRHVA